MTDEVGEREPGQRVSLELEPLHAEPAPAATVAPPTRPSVLARIGWAVAWTLGVSLAALAVLRLVWADGYWLLMVANMFTPYIYLPAYVLLGVSAFGRRWGLNLLMVAVIAFHLMQVGPSMLPRSPGPHQEPELKLVTANLYIGNPRRDALIDEINEHFPDVLFLQEVNPEWHAALDAEGVLEAYPHGEVVVRSDPFGIALLSKRPLSDLEVLDLAGYPAVTARVQVGDASYRLLAVHPPPPLESELATRHQESVAAILDWVRNASGSYVIAGDFNSTPYSDFSDRMAPYGHDGWDLAGRGFGFTAPNGTSMIPPVRVDRVFVSRDLTVPEMILGDGPGSDHRLLMARVALRAGD
ncbi:MAG: endonuclease/exonuclease/phosphatase family protein [Myxococcota bacterium]